MSWSFLIPLAVSVVLSAVAGASQRDLGGEANLFGYPKAFSLTMMLGAGVVMSAPAWPAIRFDREQTLIWESIFSIFLLIGIALAFFKITIRDSEVVQGFWPVKNLIKFQDIASIRDVRQVRNTYLMIVLRSGKEFKFDGYLANYDSFCTKMVAAARKNGVTDVSNE